MRAPLELHPAALVFLWVATLVTITTRSLPVALCLSVLVFALSWYFAPTRLHQMIGRSRYLLVAIAVSSPLVIPGQIVPMIPVVSFEGINAAVHQLSNVVLMIAMVTLLMTALPPLRLVVALVTLLRPLAFFGIDRWRLAVRMILTLEALSGDSVTRNDVRATNVTTLNFRGLSPSHHAQQRALFDRDSVGGLYVLMPRWRLADTYVIAGSVVVVCCVVADMLQPGGG